MNKKNKQITIKDELTEFLLYTTPNRKVKVEIYFYDENVWLTQKRMSELFGVGVNTINYHLKKFLIVVNWKKIQLFENIEQLPMMVKNIIPLIIILMPFYPLDIG